MSFYFLLKGKFLFSKSLVIIMKTESITSKLIAPCGMNCGICMAYLREKNHCPGCRFFNAKEPISIAKCKIKNCEFIKSAEIKFCFECKVYPCARLKNLDKRYRNKYGMSMIENLENINKLGIREFVKNERVRWACSKCGGTINVHRWKCFNCGAERLQ